MKKNVNMNTTHTDDGGGLTALEPMVADLVQRAPAFAQITSSAEAQTATDFLGEVRMVRKRISDFFDPEINAAHKLHRNLIKKKRSVEAGPAKIEDALRRLLTNWANAEEERRREEQRRLDEEARQAAVTQAIVEGDAKMARAIESGKVSVVSMAAPPERTKITGVAVREIWTIEVTDKRAFVRAALAGKIPFDWVVVDEGAVTSVARASKGGITIPGITIRSEQRVAATGAVAK